MGPWPGGWRGPKRCLLEEEFAGRNAEALARGGEELELHAASIHVAAHAGRPRRHPRAQGLAEGADPIARQPPQRGGQGGDGLGPVSLRTLREEIFGARGERAPDLGRGQIGARGREQAGEEPWWLGHLGPLSRVPRGDRALDEWERDPQPGGSTRNAAVLAQNAPELGDDVPERDRLRVPVERKLRLGGRQDEPPPARARKLLCDCLDIRARVHSLPSTVARGSDSGARSARKGPAEGRASTRSSARQYSAFPHRRATGCPHAGAGCEGAESRRESPPSTGLVKSPPPRLWRTS